MHITSAAHFDAVGRGIHPITLVGGLLWLSDECVQPLEQLRDEFLNETLFTSLSQTRIELEAWGTDYNTETPHSSLGNLNRVRPSHRPCYAT